MLINCSGLELSEGFLRVSKAISNKITNPILEGIKIEAEDNMLILSATDTELSIEKKIKADVKLEGQTVVPGRFITEFVKKLANTEIELEVNDKNQLFIRYEDNESVIQCYNSEQYPGFKKIGTEEYFLQFQDDFKNYVLDVEIDSKNLYTLSLEDGCYFKKVYDKKGKQKKTLLIPSVYNSCQLEVSGLCRIDGKTHVMAFYFDGEKHTMVLF